MKKEERALVLKEKWNASATEAPSPRSLETDMIELEEGCYAGNPFPLSAVTQKRLLELTYKRRSGIITRQELIDVLFNTAATKPSTIFERLY